ncbi:MAG: hypothetical protein QOI74_819, partial [Micromonosporaceae bacterium]|nr:hypothetical protein [Micromonosporaceae bacterium]
TVQIARPPAEVFAVTNDIEVVAGRHGEPVLTLLGDASALARRCGFRRMLLSIAHEKRSAVAVVFAL